MNNTPNTLYIAQCNLSRSRATTAEIFQFLANTNADIGLLSEPYVGGVGRPDDFIVGGDFNAKHESWGSAVCDARGVRLAQLAAAADIHVLNVGSAPTFEEICESRVRQSIVDSTWCSARALRRIGDWR